MVDSRIQIENIKQRFSKSGPWGGGGGGGGGGAAAASPGTLLETQILGAPQT